MLKKLIALTCLTLSIGANAALIDNGSYVTDDVAMVDYLKLSNTYGRSWNEVVVNDSLGYIADGWAVTSERALFDLDSAGPEALALVNDVGASQVITNGQTLLPSFVLLDVWILSGFYCGHCDFGLPDSSPGAAVSFQRVSAVPIPAAGYLLMSAIAGFAGLKRFARK